MDIFEQLKPREIPHAAIYQANDEMNRFYEVSRILEKAGIHGEENLMRTYEVLGIGLYCGKLQDANNAHRW